ncbi:MerR family transcriptional regulator [Saccharopolyspora aridisoli]|uniref:MerR family transcriptional regulator n=1 Tax=Saccharopolyspora aridisoli TaxID=2530385 RepID=A0A4R4U9R1_9PSEU|nr:MerR family transcriptional regulator [Saccharopolyspora aridisoli]TDC88237.1 MerR family transcriptional regulator [Saccharopolyspora aridisoli]
MNPLEHKPLTIGQVAELADVSPRTIRHYHQIGLLDEAERDSAGRRIYRTSAIGRLLLIRKLVDLGLSLRQIEGVADGTTELADLLDGVERDLAEQERRIARQREALRLVRAAGGAPALIGEVGNESEQVARMRRHAGVPGGQQRDMLLLVEKAFGPQRAVLQAATDNLAAADERLRALADRVTEHYDYLATADPDDPRVEQCAQDQLELADAVREAELAAGIDGDALWQDLAVEEERDPEVKALAIQAMTSEVPQLSPAQHHALRRYLQEAVAAQTRPA